MERVRVLAHKGKDVLLLDASQCQAAEAGQVFVVARKLLAAMPPKSALTLTDVTGAMFDDASTREVQTNATVNVPFVRAAAVVGVTGLKKIVYNAVVRVSGRDVRLFDTREQALDWLVQQ